MRAQLVLAGLLTGAALVPDVARASANHVEPEPGFVERVRAATDKYHDRDLALADGYRLIGRDFPGMGEHWVHIGRLFDGVYDPTRPEFLSYVLVDGRPRLLGVAYGLPLLDQELPPDQPAGREAWHDHRGTIDEETLRPHHHHAGHAEGPRLAMVHAWVWQVNPEGLFAADNWSIPFVRLGLAPPSSSAPAAARALTLLSGGDAYAAEAVANSMAPSAAPGGVREAIERARGRIEAWLRERPHGPLASSEIEALDAAWAAMWSDIEAKLPPDASQRLRASAVR